MLDLCKIFGVEEGEKFKIDGYEDIYFIENGYLYYIGDYGDKKSYLNIKKSYLNINDVAGKNIIKIPKKKQFTDDELCILRNIDKKYKLVARDKNGDLYAYPYRPMKGATYWGKGSHESLFTFNSLFTEIKWEDEEPVYIDDYVNRQNEVK